MVVIIPIKILYAGIYSKFVGAGCMLMCGMWKKTVLGNAYYVENSMVT